VKNTNNIASKLQQEIDREREREKLELSASWPTGSTLLLAMNASHAHEANGVLGQVSESYAIWQIMGPTRFQGAMRLLE
jgi:hypothetical protein